MCGGDAKIVGIVMSKCCFVFFRRGGRVCVRLRWVLGGGGGVCVVVPGLEGGRGWGGEYYLPYPFEICPTVVT